MMARIREFDPKLGKVNKTYQLSPKGFEMHSAFLGNIGIRIGVLISFYMLYMH